MIPQIMPHGRIYSTEGGTILGMRVLQLEKEDGRTETSFGI